MINLGLTRRWAGREGAVERAVAALKRRSGGVGAANYVRHIPLDFSFPLPEGTKTLCGRAAQRMNLVAKAADAADSDVCLSCAKKWSAR